MKTKTLKYTDHYRRPMYKINLNAVPFITLNSSDSYQIYANAIPM